MANPPTSMRPLLSSLVEFGKVITTEAEAKLLKRQVERLISRSKKLDLTARRRILAWLSGDRVARKFLNQVVPQFKERVGGYVRIVKLPHRQGDQAPLARVEFVEEIKEKTIPAPPPAPDKRKRAAGSKVGSRKPKAVVKPDVKNKSNQSRRKRS